MKYHTRSMRRRGKEDQWEIRLMHKDPITGETVNTYHTITAKTQKQAERVRDELVFDLEAKGAAFHSETTVQEFLDSFMRYKEHSGTIELSTVRGYRTEIRQICRYIGSEKLSDLSIPMVNEWMAQMTKDGYAPKSVSKPFRLLKQALNWGISQDLLVKNPCDYCKPPKRVKTPLNTLNRVERSRMLEMARKAQPQPLGLAIELALTTGMRRGEICALRWSDLHDDGTITVNHALGCGEGGFYVKQPKSDQRRTIPLTRQTFSYLQAMKEDSVRMLVKLGMSYADPYILGTQELDSRPYNPTLLTKEYSAFCKMNGFDCTFHDLRHTFATFLIGNGVDVRTVASYLGHANVSMTLDIYADVDPEAKMNAVGKIEEAFDDTFSACWNDPDMQGYLPQRPQVSLPASAIPYSVDELKAMLAVKEHEQEKMHEL